MITQDAQRLAQIIQADLNTCTVAVKQPENNPDNSLITVRAAGNSFLHDELKRLMGYAKDMMPMIYANEDGLFFMFA